MSATKTYAALAVAVSEVGYHGARRNALGDIFENLDVTKLTFKCCRSGGKGCSSCQMLTESIRRRAAESLQAGDTADKAHFAGTCCTRNGDHPVANGSTRLWVERKLLSNRWMKTSTPCGNNSSSRCGSSHSGHNSKGTVASSSNTTNVGCTSMAQQQQQQQHLANAKVANSFHHHHLYQNDHGDVVQADLHKPDGNSNHVLQESNNNTNTQMSSSSTPTVPSLSEKNISKSLVRKLSQSQYNDQIDHCSSSMANLRAKDCAKRSIVC